MFSFSFSALQIGFSAAYLPIAINLKMFYNKTMNRLYTPWADKIDTTQYPRPQMVRDSFQPLDGKWKYLIQKGDLTFIPDENTLFEGDILVPFSPESILSGVERTLLADEVLVYRTTFARKQNAPRALLHFGAVDYECRVYLNGYLICTHTGGYTPFEAEVSQFIEDENTLDVCVVDPSDSKPISRGKQTTKHGGIWYAPTSGIWQSVWLEYLPKLYVKSIKITPDLDNKLVKILALTNAGEKPFTVRLGKKDYLSDGGELSIPIEDLIEWSPENPYLYDFTLKAGEDTVKSYFAMRKFSLGTRDDGKPCFMLNNKPYFMTGLLDQGYWSDGLYTAPSDEALEYDILLAKSCGFNTLRKHIKIEPLRWYYHCDRLGMIVWQDFVNGGGKYNPFAILLLPNIGINVKDSHYGFYARKDKKGKELYYKEMDEVVATLYNSPSIALWTTFNEGWGQFDSDKVTEYLLTLDNTRLIDSTSGWSDQGGKIRSIHKYFVPFKMPKREKRPVSLSEYGGYSLREEGHSYSDKIFGYAKMKNSDELNAALEKLWTNEIIPAREKGLCAAIYTQLSDVEEEVNGIVTYDRQVVKVNKDLMKSLNEKLCDK